MRRDNYQESYVSEITEEEDTDPLDGYDEVEFEIDLELYELGLDKNKREEKSEKGGKMTFRLFFATLLSVIFLLITPLTVKGISLQVYWWAPMVGAFVGALVGAYIGSIFDAFNAKLPSKRNRRDIQK